jgi:hypothetical protein
LPFCTIGWVETDSIFLMNPNRHYPLSTN